MISICHTIIQISNHRIHYWNSNCSLVVWLIIFTWYIVSKSTPTFCDSWYWRTSTDWSSHINWELRKEFEFFCYVTYYFVQVLEDFISSMNLLSLVFNCKGNGKINVMVSTVNRISHWLLPFCNNWCFFCLHHGRCTIVRLVYDNFWYQYFAFLAFLECRNQWFYQLVYHKCGLVK